MGNDYGGAYLRDIPTGKANGISRKDLAAKWGTTPREVSATIARLRNAGHIIASSNAGYYIPADDEEHREYYAIQRARALSILQSLKTSRRTLKAAGVEI